jgi:hypothetical protein
MNFKKATQSIVALSLLIAIFASASAIYVLVK